MTDHKYKPGDRVRVVANFNEHGFDLGEVVTLFSPDADGFYAATNDRRGTWYVHDDEIAPIDALTPEPSIPVSKLRQFAEHLRSQGNETDWGEGRCEVASELDKLCDEAEKGGGDDVT